MQKNKNMLNLSNLLKNNYNLNIYKCEYCLKYEKHSVNTTCNSVRDTNFICKQCDIQFIKEIKSCPNCETKIQKNGGCNHITCIICTYEWCWMCKEKWKNGHVSC